MIKHHLLLYRQVGRRVRGVLLLSLLILGIVGVYDLRNPVLGDEWYLWWVIFFVILFLWIYYTILVRRAALQVRPNYLRLQGPIRGFKISYGRIHSVTSSTIAQHYPADVLNGYERSLLEPLRRQPAVFIELRSFPKALKHRRWWFPRLLFGTARPGLLLIVEDWMTVSQDVEVARDRWRTRRAAAKRPDAASVLARVLDT